MPEWEKLLWDPDPPAAATPDLSELLEYLSPSPGRQGWRSTYSDKEMGKLLESPRTEGAGEHQAGEDDETMHTPVNSPVQGDAAGEGGSWTQ